jgi:tRNA-dependent cyclodipeptide synthase
VSTSEQVVAFIGQSLGSHSFSQEFYERAAKYCAAKGIASTSIVLADVPHRFSLMALKGLTESDAVAVAERLAEEKFRFLRRVASRHASFTIHRWHHFAAFPNFIRIRDAVYREYESCASLKDAVDRRFLTHVKEESPGLIVDRDAVNLGIRYILDELSLMLLLYGPLGYRVQIAPFEVPDFLIVALNQERIASLPGLTDFRHPGTVRLHVSLIESAKPVELVLH